MLGKKTKFYLPKAFSFLAVCGLILGMLFAFSTSAMAKTDSSAPAPSLIVNILNPDGTTALVHEYLGEPVYDTDGTTILYYTYPELEALASLNYYATIDAMPAAVGTKALGVTISALVKDAKKYNPNIKWESGQKFVMYPTDATTIPYQSNNFYTYDFVQGSSRYYYPNLVDAYTKYKNNGEDISYLANALENPEPVEPVLAVSSYQERYTTDEMLKCETVGVTAFGTPGTADYREIITPVTMDGVESFRFCMGLTPAEAENGIAGTYSSTNKFCRWAYRIDFGPVNGQTLTADFTDNIVGQPIVITYTDKEAWRNAITGITIDGTTVDPLHYTIAAGTITFDSTVFTTAGSHAVLVAATDFMNSKVTQKIGIPPTLYADSSNNAVGQPIDIAFSDNASWRDAVTGVTVNGTLITDYTLTPGNLTIPSADFATAGSYAIVVTAINYLDATIAQTILNAPPVLSVNSARVYQQPFNLVFTDDPAWRAAITDIKVGSTSKLSSCTIAEGAITLGSNALAEYSQTITVIATNYMDATITLPGVITADNTNNTVGQPVDLTYTGDSTWSGNITDITVNGNSIAGKYSLAWAKTTIAASVFGEPGTYTVAIQATGYADAIINQTIAIPVLTTLRLSGSPALTYSGAPFSFDLSGLTLAGKDQDGLDFSLVGQTVSWAVYDGPATVSGSTLTIAGSGTVSVSASVNGVTSNILGVTVNGAAPAHAVYTLTPITDAAYQAGSTTDGIKTMTVIAGVSGMKYFGVQVAPVITHSGLEAVVFVHLRNGVQLSMNVTRADFDTISVAQAGFNIQAGDVVKAYIVDDLTNDLNFNPTILQ